MTSSLLYCGDTDLNGAASYLAGLMASWGWFFEYVPSHQKMTTEQIMRPRSLLILSDYPAAQFPADCQQLALQQIEQGGGLLMIGGWESFHGYGGNWDETPLGAALPVVIESQDDRMNFAQSAWLSPAREHPVTRQLPWLAQPPAIGGMNRVTAKPGAQTLLKAHSFAVQANGTSPAPDQTWTFTPAQTFPALVVGERGLGRTAAFLSDVAPHWVGGFVDWGMPRVTGQATNGQAIEVGSDYAQFWKQLLEWTGRFDPSSR